ncbi:UvrD-like helicase C-terminal domain protein [Acididesulfobacillus acetoxydans]|uniref:ATP-dependent DNA helicase PcrA n=1 Tax=Acididesulfobacillus acetoxydans TaxID=1561005 RepID=A0A8S0W4G3_9FIRM|nr:UvrD-helicase domain-containing protein [Acididesulfobacillus acetoxydans]CAA7602398.1 UvrD-like helicase C-terminal domain protein [Acididesulfobacillus acetoxydans]CEJ08367.1 ATP-dependent DNA helicase PcrA [Acididesulfobacillus acetoxydans]
MYSLADLNPVQREAVEHRDGPLLILAGAGSGKTRVLTYRIAHLVARGVAPWSILAITFTNKAAKEMRQRVETLLGSAGAGLWVSTFHSACVRILRREIDHLSGYARSFVIYDTGDQLSVLKSCLKELDLDEKKFPARGISAKISDWKNRLCQVQDAEGQAAEYFEEMAAKAYRLYQKKLMANNALDFDDIIMLTVELFRQNPTVLDYYRDRFRYILVDEYQDTNHAQYTLVNLLAARYRNLCVVGDDDQAVYGWRGADVQNILAFERDYPEAVVLKLEQNYRSTKHILQAANAVVRHNLDRKAKSLWTENLSGDLLIHYAAEDERDEARYVAERIRRLKDREGRPNKDFAVLYRSNAQSRILEEYLLREGIPYRVVSGMKFYERMEIKDILAYLRVLHNPADRVSFSRILNVPKRGLGESVLAKVLLYAEEQGLDMLAALREAEYIPGLRPQAREALLSLSRLLEELREQSLEGKITDLVEEILDKTDYWTMLKADNTPEAQARVENLQEFLSVTAEYDAKIPEERDEQAAEEGNRPAAGTASGSLAEAEDRLGPGAEDRPGTQAGGTFLTGGEDRIVSGTGDTASAGAEDRPIPEAGGDFPAEEEDGPALVIDDFSAGVGGFLEQVALVADIDQLNEGDDGVVLMTMHSAKGLEFPVVFLVGMEEGIFPSSHSLLAEAALEEERRLCYVALTRAKEKIYLCCASRRLLYGHIQSNLPSRFFSEVPPELMLDRDPIDPPPRRQGRMGGAVRGGGFAGTSGHGRSKNRDDGSLASAGTPLATGKSETYHVGDKVEHEKFGRGIIVSVKGEGASAILTVAFSGQLKQLISEYAKLTRF